MFEKYEEILSIHNGTGVRYTTKSGNLVLGPDDGHESDRHQGTLHVKNNFVYITQGKTDTVLAAAPFNSVVYSKTW